MIPAIQDSFPIERIEDRIEELARLAEGSSHSHAITNQKLGKLSESPNAVKVELQAASAARIRVEEKLDRLLATEERRFNHTDQGADTPPPAPRISPCYFCDSPNHKIVLLEHAARAVEVICTRMINVITFQRRVKDAV